MADPIVNFFKSTLVGTYSDTDTSFTIATGDGAKLPDPAVDGAFNLVIFEGSAGIVAQAYEIVRVTAKSGDVLTVTREQEGTTALTITDTLHSIILSATKKTFDDIYNAIDSVDLTTLSGVESITYDNTGDEVFQLPSGTTAQRPGSPQIGYTRFNTDNYEIEYFTGSIWTGYALENIMRAESAGATATGVDGILQEVLNYTSATGGTTVEYDSGGKRYRSHTFTSDGNFVVTSVGDSDDDRNKVDYLIIAGGGGGGEGALTDSLGGGGGAGGYRTTLGTSGGNSSAESKIVVSAQSYSVVVGAGGSANTVGNNSSALGITSSGGGYGSYDWSYTSQLGGNGGSGGGGMGTGAGGTKTGGTGVSGQGTDGGDGQQSNPYRGGGGGGAGQVGIDGVSGAHGGDGLNNSLRTGSNEIRSGGGGGATNNNAVGGTGGDGGGGNGGGINGIIQGQNGTVNTGSGGGGGQGSGNSGLGGSGIVVIRYEIAPL